METLKHTTCEFGLSKLIMFGICVQQLSLVHCSWDPTVRKNTNYSSLKIVHGTHGHYSSFKNYFAIIFSVINF